MRVDESEAGGEDGALASSASTVASAIRRASTTSLVKFAQRIESDGKHKGLILPSPDFQRLCLEQLDLFHRIVHPDALLSEEFEEHADKAKTLPENTTNENKLILYGLFKQATVGPVNTSRPGIFNMRDRAKWDAWKAVEGISIWEEYPCKCSVLVTV